LPPFRQSSPLPPEDAPAPVPTRLEIEAMPAPGHKAFLLPIGALAAPHAEALLVNGQFQNSGQPVVDVAQIPGVTSTFDAVIEPYHFYLDTDQDVPASWHFGTAGAGLPMFLPLLVIWLGYLCCLAPIAFLYDDTIEPRTLITLLGISLAAWAVLCARVGTCISLCRKSRHCRCPRHQRSHSLVRGPGVSSCIHPCAGVPERRQEARG
jgi:hypothetical protein